jgi:hypothetical protein
MNFDELLASQAGRFTRGQARACGFSAYRIGRRVESGESSRTWPGACPPCCAGLARVTGMGGAVVGRTRATFAGPSAARRHGFEIPDRRPCIVVPPSRRPDVPDGVVVLRRDLPDRDVVIREDYLLTGRDCTVIDSALLLAEQEAMRFVERALQRSWTSYPELTWRVQQAVGRRGVEPGQRCPGSWIGSAFGQRAPTRRGTSPAGSARMVVQLPRHGPIRADPRCRIPCDQAGHRTGRSSVACRPRSVPA